MAAFSARPATADLHPRPPPDVGGQARGGLTTAASLAQCGIEVVLIEKRPVQSVRTPAQMEPARID